MGSVRSSTPLSGNLRKWIAADHFETSEVVTKAFAESRVWLAAYIDTHAHATPGKLAATQSTSALHCNVEAHFD